MNKIQQDLRLLPGYFKKVAFGIMLFSAFISRIIHFKSPNN